MLRAEYQEMLRALHQPAVVVDRKDRVLAANAAAVEAGCGETDEPFTAPAGRAYSRSPVDDDLTLLVLTDPSEQTVVIKPQRPSTAVGPPTPSFIGFCQDSLSGHRQVSTMLPLLALGWSGDRHTDTVDWRQLVSPADRDRWESVVATLLQQGGQQTISYNLQLPGQEPAPVRDYLVLARPEAEWPRLLGCCVFNEPSPERFLRVERLILAGRLMGGMVHDFRNLLAGVQNMVEWCLSQSQNETVRRALSKTVSYTDQARDMIASTLRLVGGKEPVQSSVLDVAAAIGDLRDLLPHCVGTSVEVLYDVGDELPGVRGDRGTLMDMLLNLCLNARDAMRGDVGAITIGAESVLRPPGRPYVCLTVADNGCGMEPEQLTRVFQEFYSTKQEGVGLGLWMVRQAVRALHGQLEVASTPGEGTVFSIFLPAADRPAADRGPQPAPVTERRAAHRPPTFPDAGDHAILFIEDDPLLYNSISAWLDTLGFRRFSANNGREAWELFCAHRDELDVVIQDYVLPGMSGQELLQRFRAARPELPIIVISGYPEGSDSQDLRDQGAFEFISKPFRVDKLVRVLHAALYGADQGFS